MRGRSSPPPSRLFTGFLILALAGAALTGCGRQRGPSSPRSAAGPAEAEAQVGLASWYGPKFHGRITASGDRYNMFDLTAAHRDLPFGSRVRVTSMENGRWVLVTINDRGPFVKGRIIDLSYAAAKELDMTRMGVIKVRMEVLSRGGR